MKIYVITEIRMGYGWVPKEKEFFNIKKTPALCCESRVMLRQLHAKNYDSSVPSWYISVNVCIHTDIT